MKFDDSFTRKYGALFLVLNIILINLSICGIKIAHPDALSNYFLNSDIEAVYGDFGNINLGYETMGIIYIMPRDIQSLNKLPEDYACNSLSKIKIEKDIYTNFNIVLVEKGPCSYYQMAKQVEKIGGDMLLIANNEPGEINKYKIINDDWRGYQLSIPIAMISFNDGKTIINYITNHPNEKVYLSVDIGLNNRKKPKVEFFTNILDIETMKFLGQFKSYYELLNNDIDMNLYFLTPAIDGISQKQKMKDCLKNGLYCMNTNLYSKNQYLKDVDGIDLIYESLFHQCIFQTSKKSYFNFIIQHAEKCQNSEKFTNFCGLSFFNADLREIIFDCVFDSFGNAEYNNKWEEPEKIITRLNNIKNNVNSILINNRIKEEEFKVNSYPDIYINNVKYWNRVSPMYVFDAICEAFENKPEACVKYGIHQVNMKKRGIQWYEIVAILFMFVFINLLVFYCIRRNILRRINSRIQIDKNELSGDINTVISSYFNLRQVEKNNSKKEEVVTNDLGDVEKFVSDVKEEVLDDNKIEDDSDLTGDTPLSANNNKIII